MFEHAACKDMDVNVFFPDNSPALEAKRACFNCAYVRECRLLGLPEVWGIWGGWGQKKRERAGRGITARLTGQNPKGGGENTPRWVLWRPIVERMLDEVEAGRDLEEVMLEAGLTQAEIDALFADLQEQEAAA